MSDKLSIQHVYNKIYTIRDKKVEKSSYQIYIVSFICFVFLFTVSFIYLLSVIHNIPVAQYKTSPTEYLLRS